MYHSLGLTGSMKRGISLATRHVPESDRAMYRGQRGRGGSKRRRDGPEATNDCGQSSSHKYVRTVEQVGRQVVPAEPFEAPRTGISNAPLATQYAAFHRTRLSTDTRRPLQAAQVGRGGKDRTQLQSRRLISLNQKLNEDDISRSRSLTKVAIPGDRIMAVTRRDKRPRWSLTLRNPMKVFRDVDAGEERSTNVTPGTEETLPTFTELSLDRDERQDVGLAAGESNAMASMRRASPRQCAVPHESHVGKWRSCVVLSQALRQTRSSSKSWLNR